MNIVFDVEQATMIKAQFNLKGATWTEEDLRRLCEGDIIRCIHKVLNGKARIIDGDDTLLNCDTDPKIPVSCTIENHEKKGQLLWDPGKITLHEIKFGEGDITLGDTFNRELSVDRQVLNINVRHYLLQRKYLIPKEWKGYTVLFPGTLLRYATDTLCLPGLHCNWHQFATGWSIFWYGTEVMYSWKWKDNNRHRYAIAILE